MVYLNRVLRNMSIENKDAQNVIIQKEKKKSENYYKIKKLNLKSKRNFLI